MPLPGALATSPLTGCDGLGDPGLGTSCSHNCWAPRKFHQKGNEIKIPFKIQNPNIKLLENIKSPHGCLKIEWYPMR